MICYKCGKEKGNTEFTKVNISKDSNRGLCKQCKKEIDAQSYKTKKIKDEKLDYFELTGNLLIRSVTNKRIGVLMLYKFSERLNNKQKQYDNFLNFGINSVLSELEEEYEYCTAENINNYQFILVSLSSVMDIENLIFTFEKFAPEKVTAKIIVGGFGVCNIKLIVPYIDMAVFGRTEGQINEILQGQEFNNVWRKDDDPYLEKKYYIRQPRYLLNGEKGVGCRFNCKFCHYSSVRKAICDNEPYNPGMKTNKILETDWHALKIESQGFYTSAWDGWSEATRMKVSKPVTNQDIINKILNISNGKISGIVSIKVFQIVGYPWETEESIINDINETFNMLKDSSKKMHCRVVLNFLNTPFGAEPMTPMQGDKVNIYSNWRNIITKINRYDNEKLCLTMIPTITGQFTLLKRMLIHRAELGDTEQFKRIVFTSKFNNMSDDVKINWLIKHKQVDQKIFNDWDGESIRYLSVEPKLIEEELLKCQCPQV